MFIFFLRLIFARGEVEARPNATVARAAARSRYGTPSLTDRPRLPLVVYGRHGHEGRQRSAPVVQLAVQTPEGLGAEQHRLLLVRVVVSRRRPSPQGVATVVVVDLVYVISGEISPRRGGRRHPVGKFAERRLPAEHVCVHVHFRNAT